MTAPAPAPDAERRQAAILFAELRNFTRLSEVLPPNKVLELANDVQEKEQSDRRRKLQDPRGHTTPRLMLREQHVDEVDHLPGFLEAREDVLFLRLLVVVLDEITHDLRRPADRGGIEIPLGVEFAHCRLVDQQRALEHAVLTHQIFGRCNGVLALLSVVELFGRSAGGLLFRGCPCGGRSSHPGGGCRQPSSQRPWSRSSQ